jgi:hypothetical protein
MASFSMTSPLCVELPSACKLHAMTVIVDFCRVRRENSTVSCASAQKKAGSELPV